MKSILIFFFFFFNLSFFQESVNDITLPVNENGELSWSEVVNMDTLSKKTLLGRAKHYLKTEKKYSKQNFTEETASAEGFDDFFLCGDNTSKFKCYYTVKIDLKEG